MSLNATNQAGMFAARKRARQRRVLSLITQWTSGLTVTSGDYVVLADNSLWLATSSGTSGASFVVTGNQANDGGVTWTRADIQSLQIYVTDLQVPPTP
jgi:hypothetical protein